MTFTRLRNIVDTLKRKHAAQLAVYRARPLALELCDQMAEAVTPGRPKPKLTCLDYAFNLFTRLREKDIRVNSHVGLYDYLSGCLDKLLLPQVNDVLRSLFPKAREKGLIPQSRIEVPFKRRREWKLGMGYFIVAMADRKRAAMARGTWREPDPHPKPNPATAFRPRPRVPCLLPTTPSAATAT